MSNCNIVLLFTHSNHFKALTAKKDILSWIKFVAFLKTEFLRKKEGKESINNYSFQPLQNLKIISIELNSAKREK